MARRVAIGQQSFVTLREKNLFYVDKTFFIKDWWDSNDSVTVILRPRRFGKTLTMSMVESFFSLKYANRDDLFAGLSIWDHEDYRAIQGTYPVISLTLAAIKEQSFKSFIGRFKFLLWKIFNDNDYLLKSDNLSDTEKKKFTDINIDMSDEMSVEALKLLSSLLHKHHGKKPIILLDEYDTPMQEAYTAGYWDDMVGFIRNVFNSTFKSNPYIDRALMTGVTRVSKESIFSDFNHVRMVTTLSDKYATAIGFTEDEVFAAMDECGLTDKAGVKFWYDGFTFGNVSEIYNPWSIIRYLADRKYDTYWANTSENTLVSTVLQKSSNSMKRNMEILLNGGSIETNINEYVTFNNLAGNDAAAWSLLLASGYLRAEQIGIPANKMCRIYITNHETRIMYNEMIKGWFKNAPTGYNEFVKAMLRDDVEEMNDYINPMAEVMFSTFDTGRQPSTEKQPERFYHGFVLGLIVDLRDRYIITSNRESGFGCYDVMLEPRDKTEDNAIIIEFKVRNPKREKTLEDSLQVALKQIEDKKYAEMLVERGVQQDRIRKYGFVFDGKEVLIG